MGWNFPPPRTWHYLSSHPKKVIVYTHTSYFDFIIMCLYKGVYSDVREMSFAVNEDYYHLFPFFFSRIGCIPATARTSGVKGGFVNTIVNTLKGRDTYSFAISPEGTLSKSEWKGGYYYITKGLNDYENEKLLLSENVLREKESVYIIPLGLNYEKHELYIGSFYNMDLYSTREEIEKSLQKEMMKMIPLYPEQSYTPSLNNTLPTVVNYPLITTWIGAFISLVWLLSYNLFLSFTFIIGFVIAFLYHYFEEKYLSCIDKNYARVWIVMYTLSLWKWSLIAQTTFIPPIIASFLYYKGCGRSDTEYRSTGYLIYHSLFHLASAISVIYPLMSKNE